MSDLEKAKVFFMMLKFNGFGVEVRDYRNNLETDEDFDPETGVSFNLLDSHKKPFVSFDFLNGNFYRISGTDSTGWSGDEVDLKKYI